MKTLTLAGAVAAASFNAQAAPLISPETTDAAAKLDHSFRAAGQ